MLHAPVNAAEKRVALRRALDGPGIMRLPGAFNPLSAKLIERHGFEGVYISGAVISADLGLPDIGLTTLSEVSSRAAQISRLTSLPSIVDADTGFGEPLNVARTIHIMEDAGVSGLHIEDQVNPKRCGHLEGKSVVSDEDAIKRIHAAADARRDSNLLIIARTDVRGVDGFEAMVTRAKKLVDAGADALFPEALQSLEEFETIARSVSVPILANVTEFGKSELFSVADLGSAGVKMVIFPVSLLRIAMGAAERALETLSREGSLASEVPAMQTRADLYDLLDYASYEAFDSDVYSFRSQLTPPANPTTPKESTHG